MVYGYFEGLLDEIKIYSRALKQKEIQSLVGGFETAFDPSPEDEATDVPWDTGLGWQPGGFADQHDVYFGSSFDDVNSATATVDPAGVYRGRQLLSRYAMGETLGFGQTYYWRVDEVNAAPDDTVFTGDIWSFTVEPLAIPIEAITATASGANPGMGPEKTIDGSGLDELDQHSSVATNMWLTLTHGSWIQYEFDRAYKLHEMLVWNSNQAVEAFIGFGVKEMTIEHSIDGETWAPLGGVIDVPRASGLPTNTVNATIDMGGIMAKRVRLSVVSAHGFTGQSGLSEVRFMSIPVLPREPHPADGATTVSVDIPLSWRSGREAVSHEVYLGSDAENMALIDTTRNATTIVDGLDYMMTYTWSVTEVNEMAVPAAHAGDVWTFTTPVFSVVDDFESYSGEVNEEIYLTWMDGYAGDASLGGSTTGHIKSPFVETSNVNRGKQSMPIFIDNDGGFADIDGKMSSPSFSEVVRQFGSAQDWTAGGLETLFIWFAGSEGLSGQLYCKIGSTKVLYDGEAAHLGNVAWHVWSIDLSTVGGNLTSVREFSIGVEGSGAGILYIDDIRLSPGIDELMAANLLAHYPFDEGTGVQADDASGNGHNATFVGEPAWVPGQVDMALQFDGIDDYVEIPHHEGLTVNNEVTVALWINPERYSLRGQGWGGIMAKGNPRTYSLYTVRDGNLHFSTAGVGTASTGRVPLNEWSHVVAMVVAGSHAYYINGVPSGGGGAGIVLPGTANTAPVTIGNIDETARFYQGLIDAVYIYGRALSSEEVALLAGM